MSNYYVLGKTTDMVHYKAINLEEGCFVTKIMEASVFWGVSEEHMQDVISRLQAANQGMTFKYKKVD